MSVALEHPNVVHLPISAACPDCPGARLGVFTELIRGENRACAFETVTLAARAFAPPSWSERHAFGLVRRGVLVRQRAARDGHAVAIDAAGPGCVFPIEPRESRSSESVSSDYAATDVIVCLCPRAALDETSQSVARDLLAMQQAALSRVERFTQARGAPSVKRAVAGLLCVLSDTLSPPRRRDRLPAGLQQRDLARLIGVRHETFCRVLGDLERQGAVRRDAEGLLLLDRAMLENIDGNS